MRPLSTLTFCLFLLAFATLSYSSSSGPLVAEFCEWCTTEAAAQQKAWTLSPQVQCDWPGGYAIFPIPPDVVCWSSDREVILVNPHTQNVYSYQLVFDTASNSHRLEEWTLPPGLASATETVQDVYQALISFDFSYTVQGNEVTTLGAVIQSDGTSCPQGTALDHYLYPAMRGWMVNALRQNWSHVLGAFSQNDVKVSRSTGISIGAGPVHLMVGWDRSSGAPVNDVFRAGFIFNESEVNTHPMFLDMLVYDVHDIHQQGLNISMDIEFNEGLSQVAGQPVNILFSGQTAIDNPCVLQKLEEYAESHPDLEYREGGPGGPPFAFPPPGNPFEDYCTKYLCARTCTDGVCSTCQFTIAVVVPCI